MLQLMDEARPLVRALHSLPSRRLGLEFRCSGVFRCSGMFRTGGAICAACMNDSGVTPASGVRGGSKRRVRGRGTKWDGFASLVVNTRCVVNCAL